MNPQQHLSKHIGYLKHTNAMANKDTIYDKVRGWANAKGLMKSPRPEMQFLKVSEEWGEFTEAYQGGDRNKASEELGDFMVTLIILAQMYELRLESFGSIGNDWCAVLPEIDIQLGRLAGAIAKGKEPVTHLSALNLQVRRLATVYLCHLPEICLERAYAKIADRNGQMKNSVFVKEGDLS